MLYSFLIQYQKGEFDQGELLFNGEHQGITIRRS